MTLYFDDFRLDLRSRTLWKGQKEIVLTAKEFDTLLVLVENHGQVVSRDSLVERVWGKDTHLEQSTLAKHIGAVRKKLGNAPDQQTYVKTIAGRGYYFSGLVSESKPNNLRSDPSEILAEGKPRSQAAVSTARSSGLRKLAMPAGILGAVCLASAAIMLYQFVRFRHSKHRLARSTVTVLRFRERGMGIEGEWLSVGLAEMLRTELSAGNGIRIISGEETSRVTTELALPDTDTLSRETLTRIRNSLLADFVVIGSYTYLPTSREYRIDLRLQDTRTDTPAVTEAVSGPETSLFSMVAQCGALVRAHLPGSSLSPSEADHLKGSLPSSLEATKLLSQGIEALHSFDVVKAREFLARAVSLDGRSVLIRSWLAEAWARSGYEERARAEACKAAAADKFVSREYQLLLEARCRELAHDWVRALEVYRSLWTFFPDELEHGLSLMRAEIKAGQPNDAERTLKQIRGNDWATADLRTDLSEAELAESQGDFGRELTAAEQAIKNGNSLGAHLLVARAQLRAAWALDYLGKRPAALDLATESRKTFHKLGDQGGEAIAIKNVADVIDDGGDHVKALPIYQEALARFRGIGSETGVLVTMNNMGYVLKDMGDLKGAEAEFSESARIAREIGDEPREAQALNSLAGVYWRRGQLDKAETTYDAAESRFEAAGDKNRAATAIGNLALVLKDKGDLTKAQSKLERSFDMSHETGDQVGMARASGNQGDLFVMLGRLGEARWRYDQQLSIADRINDDKQRAYALFGLGRLSLIEGKLTDAKRLLTRSLDLRLQHKEEGLAAESRMLLAKTELAAGEPTGSINAEKAAKQFHAEGEPDQEAEAVALLLQSSIDRIPSSVESERAFRRLQELLPALRAQEAKAVASIAVGRYLAVRGNNKAGAETLSQARATAQECGDIGLELEASLEMARLERNRPDRIKLINVVRERAKAKGMNLLALKAARYDPF